jgi:phosphate transport system permease protein
MMMDSFFKGAVKASALLVVVMLIGVLSTLIVQSIPSLSGFGLSFFYNSVWDPMQLLFGARVFLVGTLITSFLALIISLPFSFSFAVLLGEYLKKGWISDILGGMINILAGIPSVIYGFWGLFVLVPWVQSLQLKTSIPPYGVGILTASLILAMMIIPYAAAIGRDVIKMVPNDLKEGAYSLGATRYEVIQHIVVPYAKSGLFAGVLLSFGRAVGETMAVTMVIGNSNIMPHSLFDPGNSMASVIANELSEATHLLHTSSLIELGLYLFLITGIVNFVGKWVISYGSGDRS